MSRRISLFAAICVVGAVSAVIGADEPSQEKPGKPTLAILEGQLRVHPKYLYKYYIDGFGDGQKCALSQNAKLEGVKPGSWIRIEGTLKTVHHPGSTEQNLSPFPPTWYITMDVAQMTVLAHPPRGERSADPPM